MSDAGDDRGQVAAVGLAILLAVAVVGMAVAQTYVVPAQNAETEYEHSREVRQDMQEVREGIVGASERGDGLSTTVRLGTRYRERMVLRNPPAASGSFAVEPQGELVIENATGAGPARTFWDGSPKRFDTSRVVYRPEYNEYRNAPTTVLEHSVLYERYDDGARPLTDQRLLEGTRLTNVLLAGSMSRARSGTTTFEPRTLDGGRPVRVNATDPVVVRLPTELPEEEWRTLLADEVRPEGHLMEEPYTDPQGRLVLRLEPNVTYTLRLAWAGVGDVPEPDAAYVVVTDGNGSSVAESRTREVTVEVRNAVNAPVSGVRLVPEQPRTGTVAAPGDGTAVVTDSEGRATFVYRAPRNVDVDGVPVRFDVNAPAIEGESGTATVHLSIRDTDEAMEGEWSRPLVTAVVPDATASGDCWAPGDGQPPWAGGPGGTGGDCWAPGDGNPAEDWFGGGDVPAVGGETVAVWVPEDSGDLTLVVADDDGTETIALEDDASGVVYPQLTGEVLGDSAALTLKEDGTVVDQVAYGGATTTRGWSLEMTEQDAASRIVEDGDYVDTNRSEDWTVATDVEPNGGNTGP